MKEITAKGGQTYVDLALEICDDASYGIDIAMCNGQSVTDNIKMGDIKKVPVVMSLYTSHFTHQEHKPSSALTEEQSNMIDQMPPVQDSRRIFDFSFDESFN